MGYDRRWDPCIAHRGADVDPFLIDYFGHADRKVLLVAGAGFDPRTCTVAIRLNDTVRHMRTLLVKEERPNPPQQQSTQADANTTVLLDSLAEARLESIQIFGSDGAVVGGRKVINILNRECFDGLTDIIVDISALSVGTSFPIIRFLVESIDQEQISGNLHVFVAHDPHMDAAIRATPSDRPGHIHGFRGGSTLSTTVDAALLWLPQLATGQGAALGRLHQMINPHDTCPILPFPASNPRLGDVLAEEYLTELESSWEVDMRNIVYADEGDPLDLYRTILRLDDLRRPVFAEAGDSMLVLSPVGSKVMALGALMAALERDLPVAHLEAFGYEVVTTPSTTTEGSHLIHVWLQGDAYPNTRSSCHTKGGTT